MIGPGALPGVHVIRYSLAPRAPLYRMAQGRDVLIVAMDEGEIVNEAKTSQNHVSIKNGMVMLMPKKEAYVLRNVGDTDLDLLVIDVTK
ncbi:MAG TPA: hypothetical protein VMH04_05570 [Candidatus Solibacter sp.]|nr:hypothetical protein [Candidatus Solibacter sp.]